jgi:hypothetical protein
MNRAISLAAAVLVLGVQALLAALPVGGGAVAASACAGGMACCASHHACAASETVACPSHGDSAGPGRAGSSVPCVRPLGCGHSIPGVTIPTLDPLVVQPPDMIGCAIDAVPLARSAATIQIPFHPAPTAPPPRS